MKFTHIGIERGNDNRIPHSYRRPIELRETKLFWISKNGTKYKKTTGSVLGDWPVYSLDLSSIEKIQNN